jgi:hypothetical protein
VGVDGGSDFSIGVDLKKAVLHGADSAGVALVTGPRSRSTMCSRSGLHGGLKRSHTLPHSLYGN